MQFDGIIRNAQILDGGGGHPVHGAVGWLDGIINCIEKDINPDRGKTCFDANGIMLAPGFIDAHGHSDIALAAAPDAIGKLAQGITTEIAGNCGLSAFPLTRNNRDHLQALYRQYSIPLKWSNFAEFADFITTVSPAINIGFLCGHNTLRAAVCGYRDGAVSEKELCRMQTLLRNSQKQGALGFSTGLLYTPGIFADEREIQELLKLVKGPYATHLRSEGNRLAEAVAEAIDCCLKSGQRHLHISHLKTAGRANWEKLDQVLTQLGEARQQGLTVTADRYPYTRSMTQLSAWLPEPYSSMPDSEIQAKLGEAANFANLVQQVRELPASHWENLIPISRSVPDRGWSFAEISRHLERDPALLCAELLREDAPGTLVIASGMSEKNLSRILSLPWLCGGTDERTLPPDGSLGLGHPRGYGGMTRHLLFLLNKFGPGEAVRRLSTLPAEIFGISNRGRIAPGMAADLIVFQPEKLADQADFAKPFKLSEGIERVWVNGILSWQNGGKTGQRAGKVLR